MAKCKFFFDNYFTSYKLIEKLSDDGILASGTVKKNTISRANQILDSKNAWKRIERGT